MQQSLALSIGLPVALVIIMFGLGLSLRLQDFTRCFSRPWPLLVGLVCQVVILPLICFALVFVADLPPSIGVGMMLLAASPGGPSAAIYTHLARGDLALSLTFSAVTTVVALFSLPIIANMSLVALLGQGSDVRIEPGQVLQIFLIAIVPALAGVFINNRYAAAARRLDKPVRLLSTVFLTAIVLFALLGQWELVLIWGPTVGVLVVVFNAISLAVGYFLPLLVGVERRQAIALSLSIGVHNAALVMTIAMSEGMLGNAEMAIPPAAYGLFSYVISAIFVWLLNRSRAASPAGQEY